MRVSAACQLPAMIDYVKHITVSIFIQQYSDNFTATVCLCASITTEFGGFARKIGL